MHNVMLIVNAYAGTVSGRTREVIAKALAADFKLEMAVTEARRHASELAFDAVDRDFDAVIVFGGDGTINEAAQGLVGTDLALGILPGGSTNVMARSLGLPLDPVEATALVSARLRSATRRRISVGQIDGRYYLFSAGMGLDAEVVRRIEAHPESKRKWAHWAFVSHALRVASTGYRGADPSITVSAEGHEPARVLLAVCCNARPFTYFKDLPVDVCPLAALDGGLDLFGLERLHLTTMPRIAWSVFVGRTHPGWSRTRYYHDFTRARLEADHPLPVQVDGDHLGEWAGCDLRLLPQALDLLV
ncbi:MAG: diacylglycerol/lipid kinase family protein [Actinomycetota bacterium]